MHGPRPAGQCGVALEPRFTSKQIEIRKVRRLTAISSSSIRRRAFPTRTMAPIDIGSFASKQLALLEEELQAELAETSLLASQSSPAALQRAGLALLNLHVASQRTGLGGKTVFDLELDPAIGGRELPEHGFRVGDIVGIKEQIGGSAKKKDKNEADQQTVEGVVIKVQTICISVAADKEDADAPNNKLWM